MRITLNLPDDLVDKTEARGLDVNSYITALIRADMLLAATECERLEAVRAMQRFSQERGFQSGIDLKGSVHEGHRL